MGSGVTDRRIHRVWVAGGRDYPNRNLVFATLDAYHALAPITLLIHGACRDNQMALRGADRWAEEWAIENEIPYMGVPAEFTTLGKKAGPIRNAKLATMKPACLLAFPGGPGTDDAIEKQLRLGGRVTEVMEKT